MKYWLIFSLFFLVVSCNNTTDSSVADVQADTTKENPLTDNIEEVASPETKGKETIVKGIISGNTDQPIEINYLAKASMENKGKVSINSNGTFEFKFNLLTAGFYSIAFSPKNSFLLYIEPGTITEINADAGNLFDSYSLLQATPDSKLLKKYFSVYSKLAKDMNAVNTKLKTLDFSADKERTQLIKKSEEIKATFNDFKHAFINENINFPMMIFLIDHLDGNTEMEYIEKIGASVAKTLPSTHYNEIVQSAIKQKTQSIATAPTQLKTGQLAPDIAFPNPKGEIIKLSDLKGKTVLLDFWASWCRPCRAENPNVVRLYNKYKEKGFEIFSFSLDKDAARWTAAIQQDGLIWPYHASDLKGWNTATIPIYGFNSIPFTVLIDKDGKIIETNLRGPALENKLKTILG